MLVFVGRHSPAKSLLWWWGLCGGCQGVHLLHSTDVMEEGSLPALMDSHWWITNWCYWQLDVTKFSLDEEQGVTPLVSSQRMSPLCVFVLEEALDQPASCFPKWLGCLKLSKHPLQPCLMLLSLAHGHKAMLRSRLHLTLHERLLPKDISNQSLSSEPIHQFSVIS